MINSVPQVLVPLAITDAMLHSSTIAEPADGEELWVSGATYGEGDEVIRTSTHRRYKRAVAGSGTTPPEEAPTIWVDQGPTKRWALFDGEVSTQSVGASPLTLVLRPGFFNAAAFYGLEGEEMDFTVRDEPGGDVIFQWSEPLIEPVPDWYEWLFSPIVGRSRVAFTGILPYPDAELTVTITGATEAKCGLMAIGDLKSLIGSADWGLTEGGVSVEPVSFSYIKTEDDGTTRIKRRRSATDLRFSVALPPAAGALALQTLQEVLDVPCAWIFSGAGYQSLNAFGLGSGSLSYDSYAIAKLNCTVKGLV